MILHWRYLALVSLVSAPLSAQQQVVRPPLRLAGWWTSAVASDCTSTAGAPARRPSSSSRESEISRSSGRWYSPSSHGGRLGLQLRSRRLCLERSGTAAENLPPAGARTPHGAGPGRGARPVPPRGAIVRRLCSSRIRGGVSAGGLGNGAGRCGTRGRAGHAGWDAGRDPELARGRAAPPPAVARDQVLVDSLRTAHAVPARDTVLDAPLERLSPADQRLWRWAMNLPLGVAARALEMDWSPEELARMHEARRKAPQSLGGLPLFVIERAPDATDPLAAEHHAQQRDLARLSSRGRLVTAVHAGHNVHLEDPELVVQAIDSVLAAAAGLATRHAP